MKTMTHTSTKTAVAWMIVGGLVALVASMALGLPWDRFNSGKIDNNITSSDKSGVISSKKFRCYYTVINSEGIRVQKSTSWDAGNLDSDKKGCGDIYKGTEYTIIDNDGNESERIKL